MADITMCAGLGCPHKEGCFRFTATPNEYRQSFFSKTPLKEDNSCDYFYDNGKLTKQKLREITEPKIKS